MDVIDLISSSPPRVAIQQVKSKPASNTTRSFGTAIDLSSDGFSTFDNFSLSVEQPSKKRKVQYSLGTSVVVRNQDADPKQPSIFDLSSDAGSSPSAKASRTPDLGSRPRDHGIFDLMPFSSSAPETSLQPSTRSQFVLDLSSDTEVNENDEPQTLSQPSRGFNSLFSQQTASLLASIREKSSKASTASKPANTSRRSAPRKDTAGHGRFKRAARNVVDDSIESSQPTQSDTTSKTTKKPIRTSNQTMESSQKIIREEKKAEKEAERQRKQEEKEERQRQKQRAADIAEVNKSKTNKKNSTPEMIIEIPTSLKGSSMCNQIEEYMKELGVQTDFSNTSVSEQAVDTHAQKHGSILTWRRKVVAEYDEDHEIWQPLAQPRISKEDHVLVYWKAEDFMRTAVVGISSNITSSAGVSEQIMTSNIDAHIVKLRQQYPQRRLLYMIEGLSGWLKKSANAKNRAFTAAVRAHAPGEDNSGDEDDTNAISEADHPPTHPRTKPSTSRRKKSKPANQIDYSSITESLAEDLLLHMQLHHQPLQIHHTTSVKTSAAQISTFTAQLSTRPYRLAAQNANLASASFCMTTGQIRTGTTASETWLQMLQEINRVTPSMAYGIVGAGYTTPRDLVNAFRRDGRLMLEDVRKSTNKDGGWSDRRLGPMVSKRVFKVFMGIDPNAMDGMA